MPDYIPANTNHSDFKNLQGQRFGRLIVIELLGCVIFPSGDKSKPHWLCECDCGNRKAIISASLIRKLTESCGCIQKEQLAKRNFVHGLIDNSAYSTWKEMKNRCLNKNAPGYKNYGGRGIEIAPEWLNDYKSFYEYIGEKPSSKHSIERIDNDGDYEPGNVKWATRAEQNNNKRNTRFLTFEGETMSVAQWAEKLNVPRGRIQSRLGYGWNAKDALTLKARARPKQKS